MSNPHIFITHGGQRVIWILIPLVRGCCVSLPSLTGIEPYPRCHGLGFLLCQVWVLVMLWLDGRLVGNSTVLGLWMGPRREHYEICRTLFWVALLSFPLLWWDLFLLSWWSHFLHGILFHAGQIFLGWALIKFCEIWPCHDFRFFRWIFPYLRPRVTSMRGRLIILLLHISAISCSLW